MNAINVSIYGALTGSTALTSLLYDAASIYHLQAPDGASLPYVVFNKQSGVEDNDNPHRIKDMIYQVRGYTKQSAQAALAIDEQVDAVLHNASLTPTGYKSLKAERVGDIEDANTEQNTDVVFSAGGLYRLRAEKTS